MGRMTASLSASLAHSSPATSDHWMFGFSMIIAPAFEMAAEHDQPVATKRPVHTILTFKAFDVIEMS